MRELKFRAWDTRLNKMWSAEEMGQDQLTISPDGRGFVNVNGMSTKFSQWMSHLIPEQYTGLKDKNGKEIYEGDIVKMMTYLSYERGKENKYRLEVAKSGCPCGLHTNGMVSICEEGQEEYTPQMEIIGNIHQNPEILAEKGKLRC